MKLQATGEAPRKIDPHESFTSTQMLEGDKRGVRLALHRTGPDWWFAELVYLTSWGTEREFTRVLNGPLERVAADLRLLSKAVLPPGAGFPATPQYETRQAKLAGMMETLTLVALSDVLGQIDAARPQGDQT